MKGMNGLNGLNGLNGVNGVNWVRHQIIDLMIFNVVQKSLF